MAVQQPTYTVRDYRGKPTLFVDGRPEPCYTYCYANDPKDQGALDIHHRFAAHGCHVYMPQTRGGIDGDWSTTPFWTDHDVFPDVTAPGAPAVEHADLIDYILAKVDPDARFWVRSMLDPPLKWRERFPDDLLLNSYGKRYQGASLASDRYIGQIAKYLDNLVSYCEGRSWADRVLGYVVYPIGEGTTVLTCEGFMFDRSPVMQRGFREFLRRKYGSDSALQDAWERGDAALETVEVPDDETFHERGKTRHDQIETTKPKNRPAPHRLHWPHPHETAAERDYCLYMRELTARNFRTLLGAIKRAAPNKLAGLDAFKQTLLGWPLVARHAGDYQTHSGLMHVLSGAFGMAEMLDIPELDIVATPHDYLHRGMGFGYEGEGIGDSVVRHGKMMMMEEDQRTFCVTGWRGDGFNSFANMAEAKAGLWRNLASSVTRGYNTYPMDVCGPSFYFDDGIQEVLGARRLVHEAATHWERREVPCVVMFVDDWSTLYEDFTARYQYLAVIHQRLYGLSRCGAPFRLHLLEDLERDDFPTCHRVFLFPNLFHITPERLELLRRKVFRDGNVCIWGPASGITNGRELSGDSASELTGIPLKLLLKESPRFVTVDRFEHPVTAGLGRRLDFGDSLPYGPILVPQDHPDVVRLGGMQFPTAQDGAGLVVREFGLGAAGNGRPGERGEGDWASVFSTAVPLPDELLRPLARYGGTHVYSESDDLIFADSCTVGVHSVMPGRRLVALPQPSTVWDLIERRKVGEGMTQIEIDVTPPQTNMYYLGDDDPLAAR